MEPVVMLPDGVYVKAAGPAAGSSGPSLVTALGVIHPLRRFGSVRNLAEHGLRLNRRAIGAMLSETLERRASADWVNPLRYFVCQLAPAFMAEDWDPEAPEAPAPPAGSARPDLAEEIALAAGEAPGPQHPAPSLWTLGRVWLLADGLETRGRVWVRSGDQCLGVTGHFFTVHNLETQWQTQLAQYVAGKVEFWVQAYARPGDEPDLRQASAEVARTGAFRMGDLVFIAGSPPAVGHIIPPHYNQALGRDSDHDLALTAHLILPLKLAGLGLFERSSDGRWHAVSPPHGFCLGQAPHGVVQGPTAVLAYLRWAAIQVVKNGGRFHEAD
jgi:hypothetical protein